MLSSLYSGGLGKKPNAVLSVSSADVGDWTVFSGGGSGVGEEVLLPQARVRVRRTKKTAMMRFIAGVLRGAHPVEP